MKNYELGWPPYEATEILLWALRAQISKPNKIILQPVIILIRDTLKTKVCDIKVKHWNTLKRLVEFEVKTAIVTSVWYIWYYTTLNLLSLKNERA